MTEYSRNITIIDRRIDWHLDQGRVVIYGDVYTDVATVSFKQGDRHVNGGNLFMEFKMGGYYYTKSLDCVCSSDSILVKVKGFLREVAQVEHRHANGLQARCVLEFAEHYNIHRSPCKPEDCKPVAVDFGNMKFDVTSLGKSREVDVQIEHVDINLERTLPGTCARFHGYIVTNHGVVFVDQPYTEGYLTLDLTFQKHLYHKVCNRVYCIEDIREGVTAFVKEVVRVQKERKLPVVIESNTIKNVGSIRKRRTFTGLIVTNFGVVYAYQNYAGEYLTLEIPLKGGTFKKQFLFVKSIKELELAVIKFVGDTVVEDILSDKKA